MNDAARRARAEQQLAGVTDPRAVPMIWGLFILGSEGSQVAAVSMLDQIEGPAASNALAALAIFSPRAEVQRRASESLTRRDLRDILTRLIGPIRKFRAIRRLTKLRGRPGTVFQDAQSRCPLARTSTPFSKRNSRQRLGRWQWTRTRSSS
jgi:hypothetical protein